MKLVPGPDGTLVWDHLHSWGGRFPHPFQHCCSEGQRRVCLCGFSEHNTGAHTPAPV